MRIAYLVNQYPKNSHSFVRREIQALERQGIEVERFSVRTAQEKLKDRADLAERGSTRVVLGKGPLPLLRSLLEQLCSEPLGMLKASRLAWSIGRHSERGLLVHAVYLAEASLLYRWLKQKECSHLHAHFGTNSTTVAMLCHALGGPPYSFTVHGPEEFDRPAFLGLGEKLRRCRFAVAISSYGRSQLYRWVEHAHWSKLHVVHCGLERAFHAGAVVPVPAAPRLVCVGRLCEQKGQLLLVQAAQRLRQRGIDFELVLAGDGEMRAEVEALIASLGLQARVRVTGWIGSDEVRREMLASRALVLPSFAEGLPVVIMEAMALRRPVITTCIAGIPELVRPQENGWLLPAGDVEALAAAMEACLSTHPDMLARMGEAAHRRVLERHDIDTEAARLADLFGRPAAARTQARAA